MQGITTEALSALAATSTSARAIISLDMPSPHAHTLITRFDSSGVYRDDDDDEEEDEGFDSPRLKS